VSPTKIRRVVATTTLRREEVGLVIPGHANADRYLPYPWCASGRDGPTFTWMAAAERLHAGTAIPSVACQPVIVCHAVQGVTARHVHRRRRHRRNHHCSACCVLGSALETSSCPNARWCVAAGVGEPDRGHRPGAGAGLVRLPDGYIPTHLCPFVCGTPHQRHSAGSSSCGPVKRTARAAPTNALPRRGSVNCV